MATVSQAIDYPTSDGQPMAETEEHLRVMIETLLVLKHRYADDPMTYVQGNMLMYYERGDRHRHVAPDVFVVKGIPKQTRLNYLVWEEGKGPDFVLEISSQSTILVDLQTKHEVYRSILKVSEYILFDPLGDYLSPTLKGFRLVGDRYESIAMVDGRLPSEVLGLDLEADGATLRFYDPEVGGWLLTPMERADEAEEKLVRLQERARTAEAVVRERSAALARADVEIARLRQELADHGHIV